MQCKNVNKHVQPQNYPDTHLQNPAPSSTSRSCLLRRFGNCDFSAQKPVEEVSKTDKSFVLE